MLKKSGFATLFLAITFLLTCSWAGAAGLEAEMVIFNGKIVTVDSPDPNQFRIAQAAAIYGGKFIAVGTNEQALEYAGPTTQRIDLGGRTVLPGLVETHNHIMSYSSHFFPEDAVNVGRTDPPLRWTNEEEFLAQLRTIALKKKPGEWIVTTIRGAFMGIAVPLQKGEVTRFDLDAVTPNNPVHIHWGVSDEGLVNTKALDLLLARYPDVIGLERDSQGVATGRTRGVANFVVQYEFWPQLAPQQLAPYYKKEMEEWLAMGLTTNSTRLAPEELAAYSWLNVRGEMPLRMGFTMDGAVNSPQPDALFSRLVGLQGGKGDTMWGLGDDMLWLIGFAPTFNIDHVPGVAGSCIEKEYPREAPNFPLWMHQFYGPHGLCRLKDPDYHDAAGLRAVAKYGLRHSAMHSGGDRGINQYLDLAEEVSKQYPEIAQQRWGIDHCRFLTEEHAQRAKKLNIIFSCGPKYVYAGDKGDIGAYAVIYGEEEAADFVVPLKRLISNGLRTTMQIDEHGFHPFLALEVAVNRKDTNGKVWGPQQRISRQEALYMYTRWSSQYVLREDLLGSIEPGKYADFLVLDRDYMTVPEDEIGQINPLLTVVGGKIAYSETEFATSHGLPVVGYRGPRDARDGWKRGVPADLQTGGGGG
ncbi:MAG: amidohydrolase family protein [Acidobacteria bacterium]|nr:amidohydrolase family protein [Acidobacteriota bacterium]